MKIKKSLRLPT